MAIKCSLELVEVSSPQKNLLNNTHRQKLIESKEEMFFTNFKIRRKCNSSFIKGHNPHSKVDLSIVNKFQDPDQETCS